MAKKVSLEEVNAIKVPGRPRKYPWSEWFNGDVWELGADDLGGEIDTRRVNAFRSAVSCAAGTRGISAHVVYRGGRLFVWATRG
jgi:hypothetical protein